MLLADLVALLVAERFQLALDAILVDHPQGPVSVPADRIGRDYQKRGNGLILYGWWAQRVDHLHGFQQNDHKRQEYDAVLFESFPKPEEHLQTSVWINPSQAVDVYQKSCIAPTSYTRITLYIKEEESVGRGPCLCQRLGRGFFWFFETHIQRSYLRA